MHSQVGHWHSVSLAPDHSILDAFPDEQTQEDYDDLQDGVFDCNVEVGSPACPQSLLFTSCICDHARNSCIARAESDICIARLPDLVALIISCCFLLFWLSNIGDPSHTPG